MLISFSYGIVNHVPKDGTVHRDLYPFMAIYNQDSPSWDMATGQFDLGNYSIYALLSMISRLCQVYC